MKLIENGLIPVYENGEKDQLVNAKELHEFLEVKTEFKDWIKRRLEECQAIEDEDFSSFLSESTGGRPSKEYILKLDIAKEVSMLEKTEKGKQIRKYFINIEKKAKQKQFESIDHFQKEQLQLKFTMDLLNVNECSKLKMLHTFNRIHNLTTAYLPEYTEEKVTKSATVLLKECNIGLSPAKFNEIMLAKGFLEEKERASTKTGTKKYKQLTADGLRYGKNLISPHNQKEVQPHYYEDTFMELVDLISSNEERRCS